MQEKEIIQKVKNAISPLKSEIATRNAQINKLDEYIYGDRLFTEMPTTDVMDKTRYNWLRRVVSIYTSQLMGRSFQVYSTYDKRDLSLAVDIGDERQLKQDHLMNKTLASHANARRNLVRAIIKDNGGEEIFDNGAEMGSAYGFVIYKSWPDLDEKTWRIALLENPQNYYALWSDSNFRDRDGDVYMYQLSPMRANQLYGNYLDSGEQFVTSTSGDPLGEDGQSPVGGVNQSNKMVTVIEFTGFLEGVCGSKQYYKNEGYKEEVDDELYECNPGDETRLNLLIVGEKLVRVLTDEDCIPRYYPVQNRWRPRRPWGQSDISDEAIDINKTVLERLSNWNTVVGRVGFPKYKGIGFDATALPRPRPNKVEVLPMSTDQDIQLIDTPNYSIDFNQIIDKLEVEFVREVGISRVMFNDPNIDANSSQALITSMKSMIDNIEKKQKRWQKMLVDMMEDALRTSGRLWKEVREFVDGDDDWHLYIKWPSIFRRDDPTFQQMHLNSFNAGGMSVQRFLEGQPDLEDAGEELDRIRDEMQDPVTAAILAKSLPLLAQQVIAPPQPQGPEPPRVSVNLRGNLTPQQEGNLATQYGYQDGPFPASIGPQGNQGSMAEENAENAGFFNGNPFKGGTPRTVDAKGNPVNQPGVNSNGGTSSPQQVQTPDMNQGTGVVSQPGSGQATPTSPQGAINKTNQNNGG